MNDTAWTGSSRPNVALSSNHRTWLVHIVYIFVFVHIVHNVLVHIFVFVHIIHILLVHIVVASPTRWLLWDPPFTVMPPDWAYSANWMRRQHETWELPLKVFPQRISRLFCRLLVQRVVLPLQRTHVLKDSCRGFCDAPSEGILQCVNAKSF